MLYFIIAPGYLFIVTMLFITVFAFRYFPKRRFLSKCLWMGALGSMLGLLFANLFFWILVRFCIYVDEKFMTPHFVQTILTILKILIAFSLFAGPILVSTVGAVAGFLIGIYICRRKRAGQAAVQNAP